MTCGVVNLAACISRKARPQMDRMSMEVVFRNYWKKFLERNFRSDEEIGFTFDVTANTGHNWRAEMSIPRGQYVAWAVANYPDETEELLAAMRDG